MWPGSGAAARAEGQEVEIYGGEGFDKRFDKGEDVTRFLDRSKASRPAQEQNRVSVDFPVWMIHSLDREAKRLGVTRQSIIKMWLAERLKEASA